MDAIFLFLGLVVAITIGGLFFILGQTPRHEHASAKKIEGTSFIPSQMFMGSDGLSGLAVNERTQQICLLGSPSHAPRILPTTQLLGTFLIHNGELIGEGQRSRPKEAVNFLQENERTKQSQIAQLQTPGSPKGNQRIDLVVAVLDEIDPYHMVNFLDMETKAGGILFEKALTTSKHWHYVLNGLILQADQQALIPSEASVENEKEVVEAPT
ncbi:MAG: hypothetical protein E4H32_03015 [Nitrospirales bacterium]|nr:MAG: hypothetical protein E4H32_03015 [Nitrospirales bacterium]